MDQKGMIKLVYNMYAQQQAFNEKLEATNNLIKTHILNLPCRENSVKINNLDKKTSLNKWAIGLLYGGVAIGIGFAGDYLIGKFFIG